MSRGAASVATLSLAHAMLSVDCGPVAPPPKITPFAAAFPELAPLPLLPPTPPPMKPFPSSVFDEHATPRSGRTARALTRLRRMGTSKSSHGWGAPGGPERQGH